MNGIRGRFMAAMAGGATLLLGAGWMISHTASKKNAPSISTRAAAPPTAPAEPVHLQHPWTPPAPPVQVATTPIAEGGQPATASVASPSNTPSSPEEALARFESRVGEQLAEWSRSDDPQSLQRILAELRNPNPNIRDEALDATVQFGSRDAIPELERLASESPDPREKAALLEAANYLALPSWSEVQRQKKALQASRSPQSR